MILTAFKALLFNCLQKSIIFGEHIDLFRINIILEHWKSRNEQLNNMNELVLLI